MRTKLSLFLLSLFLTMSMSAQTPLGVEVGGVPVTTANYENVTGGDIKSGKVWMNDDQDTLFMEKVVITRSGSKKYCIYNKSFKDLVICVKDGITLTTSGSSACIRIDKHTIMTGTGEFNITSNDDDGIYIYNDTKGLDNTVVFAMSEIKGTVKGKYAVEGVAKSLTDPQVWFTLYYSEVTFESHKGNSPARYLEFNNVNCFCPDYTIWYDKDGNWINGDGGPRITGPVRYVLREWYPLHIGGIPVDNMHCKNLGRYLRKNIITSGNAYYDPDTKTLTFEDVTIERGVAVKNDGVDGLKIVWKGDNHVTTTNTTALRFEANTTMTGDKLTTNTGVAIKRNNKLTIDNMKQLTIYEGGLGMRRGELEIKNSHLQINGSKYGAIYKAKSLTLVSCYMTDHTMLDIPAFYNLETQTVQSYANGEDNDPSDVTSLEIWPGTAPSTFVDNADDATGIEQTNMENGVAEVFDMAGRRVIVPTKGVNIIRMKDGSTKKVIIR